MKKQIWIQSGLSLILMAFVSTGCQKASNDEIPTSPSAATTEVAKPVPNNICSSQLLQLNRQFIENQTKALDTYNQLSMNTKDDSLKLAYQDLSLQQVETCKLLSRQLMKDHVDSCLKSESEKTEENIIFKSKIETSCKTVAAWFKKMTLQEGSPTPVKQKKSPLILKFNASAKELIQIKNAAEFSYLANGQIKKGHDQFQQDVLAQIISCVFNASAESSTEENQFKVISEMPGSLLDLNFDFKGARFSLALEDSQHLMLGMTCFNLSMTSESNKKEILQKLFTPFILLDDKMDAAPLALIKPTATEKKSEAAVAEPSVSILETQKKSNEAFDEAIAKAKVTLHEIVKDSLIEVKKTTDETRAETIVKVKEAAREVSKEIIQNTKKAASEVIVESVATLKKEVVDTFKKPFVFITKKATQLKNSVATGAKKTFNSIQQKSKSLKKFFVESTQSASEYWSDYFSSKKK